MRGSVNTETGLGCLLDSFSDVENMAEESAEKKCLCGEPLEERWRYCPMCGRNLAPAEWVLGYDPMYPNRGLWHLDADPSRIMTTDP